MGIKTTRVREENLSVKEYMELRKEKPSAISKVEIVPPNLGDNHFGRFRITYNRPIFKGVKF